MLKKNKISIFQTLRQKSEILQMQSGTEILFFVQNLNKNFAKMNKMFAKKVKNFDRKYIKICEHLVRILSFI